MDDTVLKLPSARMVLLEAPQVIRPLLTFTLRERGMLKPQDDVSEVAREGLTRQAPYVLEQEGSRPHLVDHTDSLRPHVAAIRVRLVPAPQGKGLARWPTCNERDPASLMSEIDRADVPLDRRGPRDGARVNGAAVLPQRVAAPAITLNDHRGLEPGAVNAYREATGAGEQLNRPQWPSSRNRVTISRKRLASRKPHSQMTRTSQPIFSKAAMSRSSRAWLAANFGSQKSRRLFGILEIWQEGSACRCQKHPWTRMTFLRGPKTMSGRPGKSLRCNRYR